MEYPSADVVQHAVVEHPPLVRATNGKQKQEGTFLYLQRKLRNGLALALSDTVALTLAMFIAGLVRYWVIGETHIPAWSWAVLPIWWGAAAVARMLPSWGLGPVEELRRSTILTVGCFAVISVAMFLVQQGEETSRLTMTIAFLASLVLIPFLRTQMKRLLIVLGQWGVPVAVYGAGLTGARVTGLLKQESGLGYNPINLYDDNPNLWGSAIEGVRVSGSTDLVSRNTPVAILAMPGASRTRILDMLDGPLHSYRTVVVIPDLMDIPSVWVKPRDLSGLLGLEISCNLARPVAQFIKRSFDLLCVTLAAPFWVPVCLLIAAIIRLKDGTNAIFKQTRVGRHGELFRAWKFQTMVDNAEEVLQQHLDSEESIRQEWEANYKLKDDPRITSLGSILRKFSLDELPQLVNVLKGEMSLVGPRPLPPYHHDDLTERTRELRYRTRPGLTGLWQVSGRSDAGNAGLERYDAYYVRNWSFWLDAVILIRTVKAVIAGKGAY